MVPCPIYVQTHMQEGNYGSGEYNALARVLYITLPGTGLKLLLVLYNTLARALEFSLALYIPHSRNNKTDV